MLRERERSAIQHRMVRGFGAGVGATVVMSIPMVMAVVTGVSPMPQPVPKAVVAEVLGGGVPNPAMQVLAGGLHLAYGGVFGALLAVVAHPVSLPKGFVLGVGLWAVMQVTFLPFLGWGFLGVAVTPKVAVATLVLHLVYGGTLGWAMDHARTNVLDRVSSPVR